MSALRGMKSRTKDRCRLHIAIALTSPSAKGVGDERVVLALSFVPG